MQLASLAEYVGARRAQIDEALKQFLPTPPDYPRGVYEAMRYSLDAGGKRLRPILTLAAAETVAGTSASVESAINLALPAACAVELIHTYSLIHDDLPAMDDDSLRRGRPTNHVVHGEGMAILAGDGLLTEAFALLATEPRDPNLAARQIRTIQTIADAAGARGMVGGQAIDLLAVGSTTFDEYSLQDMHARKTGALIRAAAVSGAIMGGGSDDEIRAVGEYGRNVGLAFQIVDDILDVEGDPKDLGKTAGKDAKAGKPTYPSTFGLDASRRLAAERHDDAIAALRSAELHRSRLADIAAWVIKRTN
jgi:geranylgeranyl diphosphate synthase type II